MAEGRGSASFFLFLLLSISMLVFHSNMVHAETFTIDWHFGVRDWPVGKSFKAGDILAFNYVRATHNVLVSDEKNYNSCRLASTLTPGSGSEQFTLHSGMNYFICGYPGHCFAGMRIAVNAT